MTPIDLTEVCRRYGASVLRRCRGILGDADEAQDAAQEVFVLILDRGHQFRGDADLGSWIHRITTNQCLNRLRGEKRLANRARHSADWAGAAPGDAPADPYRRYALRAEMNELLAGLDPLGQEVLLYRYIDGMTQDEIAQVTGKSRRTVGKRCKVIDASLAQREGGVR